MGLSLSYDRGTLLLQGGNPPAEAAVFFRFDARVGHWRAEALHYAAIAKALHHHLNSNSAPAYRKLGLPFSPGFTPFAHQKEALQHWKHHQGRGVVQLPTGSGKTALGLMAMSWAARSALVVVPTRVLMHQWYAEMRAAFPDQPVGLIGDGEHEVLSLAVATYDSAAIHAEKLGNRYGLLVFDEVHHLPSGFYEAIAAYSLAPFRLGLSASLQMSQERQNSLKRLVGPLVYRREPQELVGGVLAEYQIREVRVELSPSERVAYEEALLLRNEFLKSQGLKLSNLEGWSEFVKRSARSEAGRRAMKAHRQATRIATAAPAKLRALGAILARHTGQKTLIFTKENALAYEVSRQYLIPCITHQTKIKERQEILQGFEHGRYLAIVSSNVMNEGVNIPDAAVGVNLSGSSTEREFVQRLGRILRRKEDKRAVLYEVFTQETREEAVSQRRRSLGPAEANPHTPPLVGPALSWDELGQD